MPPDGKTNVSFSLGITVPVELTVAKSVSRRTATVSKVCAAAALRWRKFLTTTRATTASTTSSAIQKSVLFFMTNCPSPPLPQQTRGAITLQR
jgi:hypothetical protein